MQVRPVDYEPQPPGPASGPGFLYALQRVRAVGTVGLVPSSSTPRTGPGAPQFTTPPTPQSPAPPVFLDRLLSWLYQTVRGALGLVWSGLGELARWLRK
ncbi:MAG: hypothetical protein N0A24_01230 [Armatimonadetes bacterium]|nr:hypothetical protein [Armatimonadota bacterium]MDW8152841.1 hypothetical protein [Armatimonadota bacterium]